MRRSRQTVIKLFNKHVTKDKEGVPETIYINGTPFVSEMWPAAGKLQVETYGDRVNNIFNVKVEGDYKVISKVHHHEYIFDGFALAEGDGVALFSDEPDYKVIAIKPYKSLLLEVERL